MKRLPFVIAVLLMVFMLIINSPTLVILWLLGGNDPFDNIVNAFDEIVKTK